MTIVPKSHPIFLLALCMLSRSALKAGSPSVYNAFIKSSAIIIGTVNKLEFPVADHSGFVLIETKSQLMGPSILSPLRLNYPTHREDSWYPAFGWNRIRTRTGMSALVFLERKDGSWQALEVLDLDSEESNWVSTVKSMISLQKLASSRETGPLFETFESGDTTLRALAVDLLLNQVCPPDNPCRMQVLDRLIGIAHAQRRAEMERVWAISVIAHGVFGGFSQHNPIDEASVKALAELLIDPNQVVRGEAITDLTALLTGSDSARVDLRVENGERDKILARLRADARSGVSFARQARDLLELFPRL